MFLQRFFVLLVAAICLLPVKALAEESLCAVVKIEISQELTLERQAFEATMRISNTLDTFPLEDLQVNVYFEDENNNPVIASSDSNSQDAQFFIRLDQNQGISSLSQGLNGTVTGGTIAPQETGVLQWVIIPTPGAGGDTSQGKLFFVGATLSLTYGGAEEVIQVAPDSIVVKPQPLLVLDYFLAKEVNGDNPFTPEIEPVEPYTLGVRLSNTGSGPANSVKLKSAQPKIIENEQGLAVDFKITGSYVNDQPAEKTLLLNFGDIPAHTNIVGRWIMETSLTGRFTEFTATYSHADEFGGELTSLIDTVNTHILVHDVLLDLPGRDNTRDFLAVSGSDELILYESEPNGSNLFSCVDCLPVTAVGSSLGSAQTSGDLSRHLLTLSSTTASLVHIKLADPYAGEKPFSKVVRADGKVLKPENYWLSKSLKDDKIHYDYFLNIFDANPTATYTLDFGGVPAVNVPPVIQYIPNKETYETGQVGFLILSSDPNKTVPTISVRNKPAGATFEQKSPGQAVFHWRPQLGQAGTYTVTIESSDGVNKATRDVQIKVNPEWDRDGDGMADAWEMENFGTLDRDGSGDFDGDGYSDREEFENETDPTVRAVAPGKPVLNAPIYDAEVTTLSPTLSVTNSIHGADDTVVYEFEVYSDEGMSNLVATRSDVPEGADTTSVVLDSAMLVDGASVQDNALYLWRVRAVGSDGTSEWENGRFFVNTVNDTPSIPVLVQPAAEAVVAVTRPNLVVANSTDVDRDSLQYSFRVYADSDAGLAAPLYEVTGLAAGEGGTTSWQVPEALVEDNLYQWQVTVEDEHGLDQVSELGSFLVSGFNNAPTAPGIAAPQPGAEITETFVDLAVFNATDPEGALLYYHFELDTANTFDTSSLQQSGGIVEGESQTLWTVSGLADNTQYFWRVKANDGEKDSDWVQGSFFVNSANDAPGVPTVANPGQGASVLILTPILQANPVQDEDGDRISYRFELYEDEVLTTPVSSALVAETQWTVDQVLQDNRNYYWRVQAQDEHGATSGWSAVHRFFVNEGGRDDVPSISFVKPDANLTLTSGQVQLQWVDDDPDSNATIELRYVNEDGFEQVIASGLSEDADGTGDQYSWNVTGLAPGVYRLKAVIQDEQNIRDALACCTVTILPAAGGITVTPQTTLETEETGVSVVAVDVVLDRALNPGDTVTINVSVSDDSEAVLLSSNSLFFTSENWNTPQTIRLNGKNDCEIDGDVNFDLVLGEAQSSDSGYAGIDPEDLVVTNQDNEQAGQTLFICSYELQSQQAVAGSSLVDFTYKAVLTNTGALRIAPFAVPTLFGTGMSLIGSAELNFPNVDSGSSVTSINAFTVRYDPSTGFDSAKLVWNINEGATPTADLSVEAEETVELAEVSDGVFSGEYEVTVTNNGPANAVNVVVANSYPADVTVLDHSISKGRCEQPVSRCTVDSLASGESITIWFKLQTPNKDKRTMSVNASGDVEDPNLEDNNTKLDFGGAITLLILAILMLAGLRRKQAF